MKKNLFQMFFVCGISCFLFSCASSSTLAYMQNSKSEVAKTIAKPHQSVIMPQDLLTVTVDLTDKEMAGIYNLYTSKAYDPALSQGVTATPMLQSYLVDAEGNIEFPQLGTIHLAGYTKKEAEQFIITKLKKFVTETPIVTIQFLNYRISVLGEVSKPGTFTLQDENMTVFEAIGLAGDLTIYGKRENVRVLRSKADGSQELFFLNLNDKNVIYSPCFYLQKDDVVYVEPNKSKKRSASIGSAETLSVSLVGILISVSSLVLNIVNVTK